MKVIVAGGAGFLGSHLCAYLLDEGHEVVCLDNLLTGSERNIAPLRRRAGFTFRRFDVSRRRPYHDDDDGDEAPGAIFHLASPASPRDYARYPLETIAANTEGTRRLLEAARAAGARFLLASTSEVYGDPLVHPQTEGYAGNVNTTGPRACYDESKRLGETFTAEYHRRYGVDARIVRLFNVYGPHMRAGDGRMVPNFIMQALTGEPLTVHGTGQQTRSLCYVGDLVRGLYAAMFSSRTSGEVFNLGNPHELPVIEWARRIADLCGSPSGVVFTPRPDDDPERRRPDIGKARRVLGWTPTVPPEDGLRRTIEWFRAATATSVDGEVGAYGAA